MDTKHPAGRTPKTIMGIGTLAFFIPLAVPAVQNIAFEVFRTELPNPQILEWTLRASLVGGGLAFGGGAVLSRRRGISAVDKTPSRFTFGRALRFLGFIPLMFGLTVGRSYGLLGLILIVGGTFLFSAGTLVMRKGRSKAGNRPS